MINSADEFVRLRLSQEIKEYRRAAVEPAPEAIWFEIIEQFPEMREWVAVNKTLPESVLWRLVRDPNRAVRFNIAMRHQLTVEMFSVLAIDSDEGVRVRVGMNKKMPEHLLNQLANDPSKLVQEAVNGRRKKG